MKENKRDGLTVRKEERHERKGRRKKDKGVPYDRKMYDSGGRRWTKEMRDGREGMGSVHEGQEGV